MNRPNVKIERVTLWLATPTYGDPDNGVTAMDTLVPFLSGIDCDLALLDHNTEELKLNENKPNE